MSDFLFQKIIEGDTAAYSILYKEYYKRLFNYGFKFTQNKDLIEDSVQEVFMDLWQKNQKLKDIEYPQAYVFTAFRFTLFKKIKKEIKPLPGDMTGTDDDVYFSQEHVIISRESNVEEQRKIENAINTLTPRQHEAIYLRFFENMSYEDVARTLKISVKATYKIMARSLSAMRQHLRSFILF